MIQNPLSAYRETRVKTASPGQLIVMLYDEAVKQCDIALDLFGKDVHRNPQLIEGVHRALSKVQDIITELTAALDFEAGGEIAQNLFSLYLYFNRELLAADMDKDGSRIQALRGMLGELRSAWASAAAQTANSGTEARSGVNIAG
ncbi:MAG TPA: flagellar export chaperone FliS [Magnetospirillaceae bacterium]|nr:flagellar export chaperone FliS [Magnetospirillaceae bacterium]